MYFTWCLLYEARRTSFEWQLPTANKCDTVPGVQYSFMRFFEHHICRTCSGALMHEVLGASYLQYQFRGTIHDVLQALHLQYLVCGTHLWGSLNIKFVVQILWYSSVMFFEHHICSIHSAVRIRDFLQASHLQYPFCSTHLWGSSSITFAVSILRYAYVMSFNPHICSTCSAVLILDILRASNL